MGYTCMLCIAYIKAGILFALEEHNIANIMLKYIFYLTFLPGLFLY